MMHYGYFYTARKDNHFSFLTPTLAGGRRPLPSEIFAESDPPQCETEQMVEAVFHMHSADGRVILAWQITAASCPAQNHWQC